MATNFFKEKYQAKEWINKAQQKNKKRWLFCCFTNFHYFQYPFEDAIEFLRWYGESTTAQKEQVSHRIEHVFEFKQKRVELKLCKTQYFLFLFIGLVCIYWIILNKASVVCICNISKFGLMICTINHNEASVELLFTMVYHRFALKLGFFLYRFKMKFCLLCLKVPLICIL